MKLLYRDGCFICDSKFEEKEIPKQAGFSFDKIVARKWATKDPTIATKLAKYADDAARAVLDKLTAQVQQNLVLSHAAEIDLELVRPDGLDYRPYQKVGIHWASQRKSSLIADEMGLGKTIQAIGAINNIEWVRHVLIVCPASLKLNWKRELEKWLTKDLSIQIIDGQTEPSIIATVHADIIIINYDILWKFNTCLNTYVWDMVVADEIHRCKNPSARMTRSLFGHKATKQEKDKGKEDILPIKGRINIGLTGTPIDNRPAEAFPILNWLDKEAWPNFFRFALRYCDAKQTQWGWDFKGHSNLEEFQKKLRSTLMIRRLKSQVEKEIPPKQRSLIVLSPNGASELVEREKQAYARHDTMIQEARANVDLARAGGTEEEYKNAIARLRSVQGVMMTEMSKLRAEIGIAKAPLVVEHVLGKLEENEGLKVIVFAHHTAVIDILMTGLKDYYPVKLTGSCSLKARQAAVDAFQNEPGVQVFVGNIQAAGVGITLTAASNVIFAEEAWVPGHISQAEDRAHRIGQTNTVFVEHLVFDDSLDAKMAQTIINKQEVIDKALDVGVEDVEEVVVLEDKPSRKRSEERTQDAPTNLTYVQREAVKEALSILAGNDLDYAAQRNNVGFNRYDARIGHSLADNPYELTEAQAKLGYKVVRKYKRQLPESLWSKLFA